MAIDIGAGAIDRASSGGNNVYTIVELENPANATGTINTCEAWAYTNVSDFVFGTGYGSNPFTCRDSESIGTVVSGSKQTFTGLDIDVLENDYALWSMSYGLMERDDSGHSGYYFTSGEYSDPGDSTTYALRDGRAHSVYGTGTEGGGVEEKTSVETGAGVESVSGRGLAGGEAGSGTEVALAGASLLANDTGQGGEFAHIQGLWEVLFSGDAGCGIDSLKALTVRAGHDMKMQTGYGRVSLPHKEVNL
jgi:hypothetical protein